MSDRPRDSEKRDIDRRRLFIETARELGCDENEAAFDDKLRRIVDSKAAINAHNDGEKGDDPKAVTPGVKGK